MSKSLWKGGPLDSYTKAELIDIIEFLHKLNVQQLELQKQEREMLSTFRRAKVE